VGNHCDYSLARMQDTVVDYAATTNKTLGWINRSRCINKSISQEEDADFHETVAQMANIPENTS